MDLSAFQEWYTVDVTRRPTEDSAFSHLEHLARRFPPMSRLDHEVLRLEIDCLRIKPHFAQSLAARATWIKEEYNRRYGYGMGARQAISILRRCEIAMTFEAILNPN